MNAEVTSSTLQSRFSSLLKSPAGFWLIFCFLLLGDFLGICQISPTINYNYLNGGLLFMGTGLLFCYGANPSRKGAGWLLILAGALAGLDFFVKFSSSVLFLGMAAVFLLVHTWTQPWKERLMPLLLLAVGTLLGFTIYFTAFNPFPSWFAHFTASFHSQTGGSHNPLRILGKQVADLKRIGINLLQFYLVPLAALFFVARRWLRRNIEAAGWVLFPLFVVYAAAMAFHLYTLTNFRFYTLLYVSILLGLLVLHLGLGKRTSGLTVPKISVMLALFLLPVLLVFGSDASFSYSLPLYLAPWFAVIFLLLKGLPPGRLRISLLTVLIVLAELQFVSAYLWFPWRWPENRLAQTMPVEGVPGLAGIRVDPQVHRFITQSRQIAVKAGTGPGALILAFYEMPGVVYWLGGYSPGLPWFSHNKHEQAGVCQALQSVSRAQRDQALVLQDEPIHPRLHPCLKEIGFDFRDYRPVGQTYNPYVHKDVVFYIQKASYESAVQIRGSKSPPPLWGRARVGGRSSFVARIPTTPARKRGGPE